MDKKELYYKLFAQTLEDYNNNSQLNRSVKQLIFNYTGIRVEYDADLLGILQSFINQLSLVGNEQNLIELMKILINEKLIFEEQVETTINILQKIIFFRNLSLAYQIDETQVYFLQDCLKSEYKGDIQTVLEAAQSDIQSIQKYKLDKRLQLYLDELSKMISKLMLIIENIILSKQKENKLEILLNQEYEREKLSETNYKALMEDEVQLINDVISEMNLDNLLGLKEVYVQPFGSLVSGFSQNSSDIDISINTNCYINERDFLNLIYFFMKNYFIKKCIICKSLEFIKEARIPLIHIEKENYNLDSVNKIVSIDICVNNVLGCTNSQMLRVISQIHPLIPKLGLIIKKWAKLNDLISKKNLTSYSFILIMIKFLQKKKYLDSYFLDHVQRRQHDEKYNTQIKRTKDKEEIFETSLYYIKKASYLQQSLKHYKQTNPSSETILDTNLSTLFKEFIKYFSDNKQEKRYIDIIDDYIPNSYDQSLYFFIIDPIDKYHNPGERSKVYNQNYNIYINAFKKTMQLLEEEQFESLFKAQQEFK